jgi:hypothetical protein
MKTSFAKPYRLLPLLLLVLLMACKKESAKTPDDYIVRVGNQAFGCYLNGQPWVADYRDAGSGIEPISVKMYNSYLPGQIPHYNYMVINGLKQSEDIEVYIPAPLIPGRILLNINTFPYPSIARPPAYGMYTTYSPAKRFMTTSVVTGYVDIISCDTILRQIEGRFEFDAINTTTNEKIKITNGYFKK